MNVLDKIIGALKLYDEEEYEEEEVVEQKPRKTVRPQNMQRPEPKQENLFAPKFTGGIPNVHKEDKPFERQATFKAEPEFKSAVQEEPAKYETPVVKREAPKFEAPKAEPVKTAPRTAAVEKKEQEEPNNGFFGKRFGGRKQEEKPGSRTISLPIENRMLNVVVITPASFDDSVKIADYLRTSQPVVVNFEHTDAVVAKRMTDYISGTIYALGGTMKKINRHILICAPKNVDIDAGISTSTEGDFK